METHEGDAGHVADTTTFEVTRIEGMTVFYTVTKYRGGKGSSKYSGQVEVGQEIEMSDLQIKD